MTSTSPFHLPPHPPPPPSSPPLLPLLPLIKTRKLPNTHRLPPLIPSPGDPRSTLSSLLDILPARLARRRPSFGAVLLLRLPRRLRFRILIVIIILPQHLPRRRAGAVCRRGRRRSAVVNVYRARLGTGRRRSGAGGAEEGSEGVAARTTTRTAGAGAGAGARELADLDDEGKDGGGDDFLIDCTRVSCQRAQDARKRRKGKGQKRQRQ